MTVERSFAVWITGLPGSGKSTVARALLNGLRQRGLAPVVLESDVLRRVLTPQPSYTPAERDDFYRRLSSIGALIVEFGVPVIFDATANLQRYRDEARALIPRFLEVHLATPLDVCQQRDPKGLYASAAAGRADHLPGVQAPYEPPRSPDLVIDGRDDPGANTSRIIDRLRSLRYI